MARGSRYSARTRTKAGPTNRSPWNRDRRFTRAKRDAPRALTLSTPSISGRWEIEGSASDGLLIDMAASDRVEPLGVRQKDRALLVAGELRQDRAVGRGKRWKVAVEPVH